MTRLAASGGGESSLRAHRVLCVVLGLLSLPVLVLCHLALTDIGRGESDLSAEWTVVLIALPLLAAHVLASLTLLGRGWRPPDRSRRVRRPRNG